MSQSDNIPPPILPHNAFRLPIHLLALLFPLSSPRTTLSSSTSVTAALRPGSQEQLVCLPGLLTTANLWLEGTLTSLPTTQPRIQPQTLLSSSISPLQPGCYTVIASVYCNLFSSPLCRNFRYNEKGRKKNKKCLGLGYRSSPPSFSKAWRVSSFISLQLWLTHMRVLFMSPSYQVPHTDCQNGDNAQRKRQRWRRREESVEHIGENMKKR